jgi:PHD/YefM family antitoxin component YafN of YafNO toxin-antitoxin module
MLTIHPQYITDTAGKKQAVVLPIKEYNLLLEELEELEDVKLYDAVKAKKEPSVPFEQYLKKRKTGK